MARRPAATPPSPARSRGTGGRFAAGTSGNLRGRAAGSRSAARIALDQACEDAAPAVLAGVIARALAGDHHAAIAVLERAHPPRKGRTIIGLPDLPKGGADALDVVLAAVVDGRLSAEEAAAIGTVIQQRANLREVAEQNRILAELDEGTE